VKIGINALYLIPGRVGGSEIYLRELLAALGRVDRENEYLVFSNRESRGNLELPENFREISLRVPASVRPLRVFWEQLVLPRLARRHRLDVLHSPGSAAPLRLPCASVVTVLDLIYLRFPETFPRGIRGLVRWLTAASAATADAVITLSEYSRDEVMWELDVSWDRIHAVALGGGTISPSGLPRGERIRLLREMGVEGPFILCVSAAHPHKNLSRLLEGYYRWRLDGGRHQLVITGVKHSRGYRRLEEIVSRMELGGEVVFTGWIPEECKRAIFAEASLFVFPSLLEGFGLPVLEAMRSGVPVACSAVPSLDEVAGEAAWRFNPYEPGKIAEAIRECLSNEELRRRLREAGEAQAARFDWDETARLTRQIYSRAKQMREEKR